MNIKNWRKSLLTEFSHKVEPLRVEGCKGREMHSALGHVKAGRMIMLHWRSQHLSLIWIALTGLQDS